MHTLVVPRGLADAALVAFIIITTE